MIKKIIPILTLTGSIIALSSCSMISKYEYSDDFTFTVSKRGLTVVECAIPSPIELEIPESYNGKNVIALGSMLFTDANLNGTSSLKSVKIPDSVATIGDFCFTGCVNLENVNIPTSLTRVTYASFQKTAIKSAILPEGCTNIDNYAFSKCTSLEYVVIPKTMYQINYKAFYNNISLTHVYYNGDKEAWDKIKIDQSIVNGDDNNPTELSDYLYFYSEENPTISGNYWHYVDNLPVEW